MNQIMINGKGRLSVTDYEVVIATAAPRVVVQLDLAKIRISHSCHIILEGGAVRYLLHGAAPEETVGIPMIAAETLDLIGSSAMNNFKAIASGGADGKLHVLYLTAEPEIFF